MSDVTEQDQQFDQACDWSEGYLTETLEQAGHTTWDTATGDEIAEAFADSVGLRPKADLPLLSDAQWDGAWSVAERRLAERGTLAVRS